MLNRTLLLKDKDTNVGFTAGSKKKRRSGLKYRRWTLRDLEYLRTVYPLLSQSEIAESLQVTKPAVDAIMRRWKITKL